MKASLFHNHRIYNILTRKFIGIVEEHRHETFRSEKHVENLMWNVSHFEMIEKISLSYITCKDNKIT